MARKQYILYHSVANEPLKTFCFLWADSDVEIIKTVLNMVAYTINTPNCKGIKNQFIVKQDDRQVLNFAY